jgi:hypothetical protein
VKNLNICTVAAVSALVLAACDQSDKAKASPAAVEVAARYCAQEFKPYDVIVDACLAEVGNGKRGSSCATFDQVDAILARRMKASNFKECRPPAVRFGPGSRNT